MLSHTHVCARTHTYTEQQQQQQQQQQLVNILVGFMSTNKKVKSFFSSHGETEFENSHLENSAFILEITLGC